MNTYTYEIIVNEITQLQTLKRSDGAFIPMDESNSDYQAYLNKDTLVSELAEPAPAEKPKK